MTRSCTDFGDAWMRETACAMRATMRAFWYAVSVPDGFGLALKRTGDEGSWVCESYG